MSDFSKVPGTRNAIMAPFTGGMQFDIVLQAARYSVRHRVCAATPAKIAPEKVQIAVDRLVPGAQPGLTTELLALIETGHPFSVAIVGGRIADAR